jgi:putative ABC transport system ATP-binding protein
MSQSILKIDQLTKSYPSTHGLLTVLHEVSFELVSGATCAIVGPSGSGKTTLLGLCAGLDEPSSGAVSLNGIGLGGLDEDARAKVRNDHVGFVFQNFQLIPTLTALENVLVPLELRGNGVRPESAAALLAKVGLGDRTDHYPVQVSGGEQQRVALARAGARRQPLLCREHSAAAGRTRSRNLAPRHRRGRSSGSSLGMTRLWPLRAQPGRRETIFGQCCDILGLCESGRKA